MKSRRTVLMSSLCAALAPSSRAVAADDRGEALRRGLADLERRHGGRLGVAVLDTARAVPVAHRGDERFALCSTHKLLAVAFVLARVDSGQESLERRLFYRKDELVSYSPVTARHVADGMTIGELCAGALTVSDNTAANLLLDSFGGPARLTAYVRSLGDGVTRLDRREPALNDVAPGDRRDTTTPLAMLETLRRIVLGTALSGASCAQLAAWLAACTTGRSRLRAAVPDTWRAGDKTGSGPRGEANDVAIFWPPARAPIVVTAYYAGSTAPAAERDAVLVEVGRLAAAG